jgi:hypothetical protein
MPVFDESDRVDDLPAELVGKSAREIAQYYMNRERQLVAQGEAAVAEAAAGNNTPPPPRQTPPPNEPPNVTRAEWNQMTSAVQGNLLASAKRTASEGKKYWARLLPQVEAAVSRCNPKAQLDPSLWETAYNEALGRNLATIQDEERAAAEAKMNMGLEAPSGGATPPILPRELVGKEINVCEGLGITPDQFRKGEQMMATNTFPVTLDNRRNKQ